METKPEEKSIEIDFQYKELKKNLNSLNQQKYIIYMFFIQKNLSVEFVL